MKVFFSDVIENSLDELYAFKSIFVGFDRNNSNLGLLPTEKKHSLFLQLRSFQIHLNVIDFSQFPECIFPLIKQYNEQCNEIFTDLLCPITDSVELKILSNSHLTQLVSNIWMGFHRDSQRLLRLNQIALSLIIKIDLLEMPYNEISAFNFGFILDELKFQFYSICNKLLLDHNQSRIDFDFNDDALKDIAEAMAITSFQLYFFKSKPKLTIEFYKRLFIPWLSSVNSNFSTALYSDWLDEFNVVTGVASDINYKSLDIMAMRLIANASVKFYNLLIKSENSDYDLNYQYHELLSDQLGLNVLYDDWFDIGLSSNSKFFPFNFNR